MSTNLFRPSFANMALMYQCSTESKAFSASRDISIDLISSFDDFSNMCSIRCKLSVICLPGI